jgi:hypothetical protein
MFGYASHPPARPGYGKKSAPGQLPPHPDQFAHLPTREAVIATYIDGLPDGADISIKTMAARSTLFGQAAMSTGMHNLIDHGHLRRMRRERDGGRLVQETWFSRTPRDDAWWSDLEHGRLSEELMTQPPQMGVLERAYRLLISLGRRNHRLVLSDSEARVLAPLAARWLSAGRPSEDLVELLTESLPERIPQPASLTRRRLIAGTGYSADRLWRETPIR